MIEFSQHTKPFQHLSTCGDFSLVVEMKDYYLFGIGDIGGHGSDKVYAKAMEMKGYIISHSKLELDAMLRVVHSHKSLQHHGMTLILLKVFKHTPLMSYVGVGNLKGMIVKQVVGIRDLKLQDGIVGYTIPSTIVTNIIKLNSKDTVIISTDGASISHTKIDKRLINNTAEGIAKFLSNKYANSDDDSLVFVLKYNSISKVSESQSRVILKPPKPKVLKKALTPKREILQKSITPNIITDSKTIEIESSNLLLRISSGDLKIKNKLSKIFSFFKLSQSDNIKTSLFFIETQRREGFNIDIYYDRDTLKIAMKSSVNYRDIISCLFAKYHIEENYFKVEIELPNFKYNKKSFKNFKELLKFGLDEEAMLLNKKLQKEVDKRLNELFEKEKLNKKLTNKAYIDNLTGAFNRYKFEEVFIYEFEQFRRYKQPFSIAMIDIDHFKMFNDTHGHLIGDEVLIMLSDESKRTLRTTDTFARWGGEEFLILFSNTKIEDSVIGSDKLRVHISELRHPTAGQITASFGVSQIREDDTLDDILKRCDDALYKAKDNGRDCVEVE